jgi:Zn finger protein HypA/HybF involved in hydrogenase expression
VPDTDDGELSTCEQCHREVPAVTESGLCPDCDEAAMIESIEVRSQRHHENPVREP